MACRQKSGEVDKDNPPGFSEEVQMFKENLSLCKRCFYTKRGSLGNMSVSELVQNLNENPEFQDKCFGFPKNNTRDRRPLTG